MTYDPGILPIGVSFFLRLQFNMKPLFLERKSHLSIFFSSICKWPRMIRAKIEASPCGKRNVEVVLNILASKHFPQDFLVYLPDCEEAVVWVQGCLVLC